MGSKRNLKLVIVMSDWSAKKQIQHKYVIEYAYLLFKLGLS